MKIVNLEQFLQLPAGSVYAKFEPVIFGDLYVKEGSIGNVDWVCAPFIAVDDEEKDEYYITNESYAEGTSFKLDVNWTCRDGLYEKNQLFAVYEKEDVEQLITKLQDSLSRAYTRENVE